jgi:hypothetical protein
MLVERVGVGEGFVARIAFVEEVLQLMQVLHHHMVHRFLASAEDLRAKAAAVGFI